MEILEEFSEETLKDFQCSYREFFERNTSENPWEKFRKELKSRNTGKNPYKNSYKTIVKIPGKLLESYSGKPT